MAEPARRAAAWLRALACGLLLLPLLALGHVSGYTDTSIQVSASGVRVIYTAPRDNLLEIDAPPGAPVLDSTRPVGPPEAYLRSVRDGWRVSAGGERCLLTQARSLALEGVPSYQYQFTYVCPHGMDELEIGYSLIFARWPEHENFARVFMAGQRQRMRFTSEQQTLKVPVAQLLAGWGKPLVAGFFDSDPHRVFSPDGSARDAPLPQVVEAAPSLGSLSFAQIDPGFIRLGVSHIFGGVDHVLFVVGLVMLNRQWRGLLLLVTAFTLAHSVTMALSVLGWVDIPAAVAEPLIAASIVYIGLENLWALRRGRGAAAGGVLAGSPWPVLLRRAALVFVFGLVHGVGFSYTLRQMGLREDLLGSLLYFNLGVELGQLAVIAFVLPMLLVLGRLLPIAKVSAGLSTAVVVAGTVMLVGGL